ncbi:twin-arginine translocation signal domain-containing protein [Paenarthrobacter sp. Y-19]|uniref:twin-arginine translocation signal domain-containing protein n=1 Tax=Paenarthrobacter sp. Y-19 TaxID=3031125 RepID=UPI0023DBF208|nr:twin-arginine translocation signal domain-containing protein [Paenarthrobacter sp. Y-19]
MVKRSTESPGISRRGFLGTAAAATALAAAGSLLPPLRAGGDGQANPAGEPAIHQARDRADAGEPLL